MQKVIVGKTVLNVYVPKRIRCPLEPEYSPISRRLNRFMVSIRNSLVKVCDGNKKAPELFGFKVDYKNFEQSDNTFIEIRCRDRVVGIAYVSRTEFNNQEAVFALYPDVFKLLRKEWRHYKKIGMNLL